MKSANTEDGEAPCNHGVMMNTDDSRFSARARVADHPGPPASHSRYLNRELGILAFNERVLSMAEDDTVPLLERWRFLCIVSSNLDEFFEVRVAWVQQELIDHPNVRGPDGVAAAGTLLLISERAHRLVERQYALFNRVLLPSLEAEGVTMFKRAPLTPEQIAWARDYFESEMLPVLTPIGLDPAHPFPRLLNKSLNFTVELEGEDAFGRDSRLAIVQAPRVLPRIIRVPAAIAGLPYGFLTLGAILRQFVGGLFPGMVAKACDEFRVTRNSELYVDEEELENLREALQGELLERHFGDAVRLEVSATCSEETSSFLMRQFELDARDLYRVDGPVNLVRLNQFPDLVDRPDLKFPTFVPGVAPEFRKVPEVFAAISAGDILLHHPYQSFQPVLDFVRMAATDPAVVAIKQTIYRTGAESTLMEYLIEAARNGKEVTVVVELLARFDEEANINWASRLEEVGAHVVYGIVGHKTHAKMLLVVRRESGKLKRYAHLATGNYHARTARLYSDFGMFTANETICRDVNEMFKELTGIGRAASLSALWQSPFTMHKNVMAAIANEERIAKRGAPARIIAKMNSLLEPEVIGALYNASQAGVKIDLIVRGVCALRPGVPDLSENIAVRSIVGQFLEHHRIFYFLNAGAEDIYLSSADWMGRNFFGRIELCFPVLDKKLKARVIREGLRTVLRDNINAWRMLPDGRYVKVLSRRGPNHSAQQELLTLLAERTPAAP
jgi:polyphosphate kinase